MPSTAPASSRVDRVVRWTAKAAVLVLGAFCALLLGVRLVVYPQIEAHRDDIARRLGAKIGQPVEIDAIVTGWNGWNPRLSIRGFRVRERTGAGTLFELPRVDLVVAWTSLPRLDLRLKELTIDSPRLAVRRDANGRVHLAGFEMPDEAVPDDSPFAAWLLRQPQVVVRDALVAWNDDLRRAPQLLLDHVQFRLQQRFGRHEAGLTGVPPPELAGPIDLRVDLTGLARNDFSRVRGKLYFRLDYADVGAWREWLPLPSPLAVESGRGALRAWVDVAAGQPTSMVADVELADVRATLGRDLAALSLAHVAGHVEWKRGPGRTTIDSTSLAFTLPDGTSVGPTDIALALDDATPNASPGGSVAVGEVDLRPLAVIAAHVPLPDAARRDIARLAPQGIVRNARVQWTGDPASPERYAIQADVKGFAAAPENGLPGVTNLDASIDMNEAGGRVRIASASTTLLLPKIFADPIPFDRLDGDIRWQFANGATQVDWRDVAFANADIAGTSEGSWQSRPDSAGAVDVKAHVTRANLAATHRYVPITAAQSLRGWLRRAIAKGASADAQLVLSGDLAAFPYGAGKDGRFELTVKARDATLDYADRWPAITGIDADVRIDGPHVAIDATAGHMNGVGIGATHAEIADVAGANATLRVDGSASGPTAQFLAFVAGSPVADWIAHATDDITAAGDGKLALQFTLPLHDHSRATVAGDFKVAAPSVELAGLPPLASVDGDIVFSEHDVHATRIAAHALGGPLTLDLASEGGHVRVDARGNADVALVRKAFDIPALAHMSGTTDWQLALDAGGGDATWNVQTSLAGVAVDLPAPIGKRADGAIPVRIERRGARDQQDQIRVDYGTVARVLLHREPSGKTRHVDRALVLLGKSIDDAVEPSRPGVWIRAADVPALDVDAWLDVDVASVEGSGGDAPSSVLAVNGIDLQSAQLVALGRRFTNVEATARRDNGEWRLSFGGDDIAGSANWHPATAAEPNGRIVARLERFSVPPPVEDNAAPAAASTPGRVHRWPAVDLVADSVEKKGRSLGKLELVAQPSGADWQIRKLALVNDAGRIDARGSWRDAAVDPKTQLAVSIDVREAGAFLARFGWPDAVKGAPTKIDGDVSWAGSPSDFDYPSLAGRLTLRSGAGQFTKLEPGVGRLLGILSLQALPRRISLDFRDVFSQGFAFDSIVGDVRIDDGVMHSDNLRLAGPAAAVDIVGDVDIARETQALDVRVHPSLSTGVSAGAAALFLANPLVGAAVGAGTLLAQKMLNNPFDQLFTYRYGVTGTFDDPVVTRGGARAANAQSEATAR